MRRLPRMFEAVTLARAARSVVKVARRYSPKAFSDAMSGSPSTPSRVGGTFSSRLAPRPTDW